MARAVLDTNVIVSAVISPNGAPRELFNAWQAGQFTLVTAPALIAEVGRTMRYERIQRRYRLEDADVRAVLALLWTQGEVLADPSEVEPLTGDPADDIVLACCRDSGVDYLVTGDRQLLQIASHGPTLIVNARALATLLASGLP